AVAVPGWVSAVLSAGRATVEEEGEARSRRREAWSAGAAEVATQAYLERKLTGLRRALDALGPGTDSGAPSVPSQN
ncbi:response regulator, partial [Streptomyces alfalfae]